jgi:23S rRNA (adenine2503-C2)-methyltransferase
VHISALRERLRALGAKTQQERLFVEAFVRGKTPDESAERGHARFPAALRDELPVLQAELSRTASILSEHPGEDGSARLLVRLADGQEVESVLLLRDGVCVSTQVGCAVGCVFCMTGKSGLIRQLTDMEIVAQVALARRMRKVRRVVFMGMGEPAHNLDAVMSAITLLGTEGGLGHKNLVFSTVGDRRVFERLPQGPVKPALAISLHTTKAQLREELLPRAPRIAPEELVALAQDYSRTVGYPIQYQYTLLEGINDGDDELETLERLLRGQYAVMNFIPYNSVEGMPWRRPGLERAREMARYLHSRGILTKLRRSAGQDVDGGCGQLRARAAHLRTSRRKGGDDKQG